MEIATKIHDEKLDASIQSSIDSLLSEKIIERVFEKDHTVWSPNPEEISNRLGWLDTPDDMLSEIDSINTFIADIIKNKFKHVVLLGMGGSSLAPEVFIKTFNSKKGFLQLSILDTTDSTSISKLENSLNLKETLFIAASKSGSTVETLSLLKYFYSVIKNNSETKDPGEHFIAITDPGSHLEKTAQKYNFRKIFINNPNIGGRYSALSFFGLVPAALIGVDIHKLLASAQEMKKVLLENSDQSNPGLVLASFLGESHNSGKDKLILDFSPKLRSFGNWGEQLIAESTGKSGSGILPIVETSSNQVSSLPSDHIAIILHEGNIGDKPINEAFPASTIPTLNIEIEDHYELGAQFYLWEFATAVAGHLINVQPFDQPDVEKAKIIARQIVSDFKENGFLPTSTSALYQVDELTNFLSKIQKNDYISIQAYIPSRFNTTKILENFRYALSNKYNVGTTLGYGPRYLHSTGQLHKGDAGKGLYIQIITMPKTDIKIPDNFDDEEFTLTFNQLKLSQAIGDAKALLSLGRKVISFQIMEKDIAELEEWARKI